MRILIAEDERLTRLSLARQLEAWGHTVTAVEDGQAAWEVLGANLFDIVITDWEMPRLSGVGLIARIRAASAANYVYIVLLTGRTDKSDIVSGIEAGADDFVLKPFDPEELRVRVLAGERIVRLERALHDQNRELAAAGDRMRHDLRSAARLQRAMLPRKLIENPQVRAAWIYVPTDELGGDAIGLELIGDRHLIAYVIDVSGHGVPAALLSVTAMHALAPAAEGVSLLQGSQSGGDLGPVQSPARTIAELNRRFRASDNDERYLTMVLFAFDTHNGHATFARAGHPLPSSCVPARPSRSAMTEAPLSACSTAEITRMSPSSSSRATGSSCAPTASSSRRDPPTARSSATSGSVRSWSPWPIPPYRNSSHGRSMRSRNGPAKSDSQMTCHSS